MLQSLKVARKMSDTFEISLLESECDALESASRVNTHRKGEPVLELLLPLVNRAIAEEDYTMLTRLIILVRTNAAKSAEPASAPTAKKLATHADLVNQQHDKVRADEECSWSIADDAKANLTAGTFHCAYRDDWVGVCRCWRTAGCGLEATGRTRPGGHRRRRRAGGPWRCLARPGRRSNGTDEDPPVCGVPITGTSRPPSTLPAGTKRPEVDGQLVALGELLPELRNPCPNLGIHDRYLKRDAGPIYVRLTPSPIKVATRPVLPWTD